MRSLIKAEPLIVIIPLVVGMGVLMLSLGNTSAKPNLSRFSWRMVLPLLGLEIISFLAVAKHPGAHYLIPLCISTGLSLVLLFYVLRSVDGAVIRRVGGRVALVGLLFLGFKDFVELTPKMYGKLRDQKIDLLGLYQYAEKITQNDVRVDYFYSDSPEFPLFYGSGFSRRVFGPLLASFYPNKLFLNVFSVKFETFTGSIDVKTVLEQHDHLYFLGDPSHLGNFNGLDPKTFETIDPRQVISTCKSGLENDALWTLELPSPSLGSFSEKSAVRQRISASPRRKPSFATGASRVFHRWSSEEHRAQ